MLSSIHTKSTTAKVFGNLDITALFEPKVFSLLIHIRTVLALSWVAENTSSDRLLILSLNHPLVSDLLNGKVIPILNRNQFLLQSLLIRI